LVRSLSFMKMHGQVTDAYFDNCIADFLADPEVLQAFVSDRGRQPAPGELEFLVAAQTRKFLSRTPQVPEDDYEATCVPPDALPGLDVGGIAAG
jgi:hypothetical protein